MGPAMEKVGVPLQLSPVELRRELQMDLRGRSAPGDLLLVHPWLVHINVQAAPIGTRRAANQ
eukprot:2753563-Alexandrium_andersonii.AAC.1